MYMIDITDLVEIEDVKSVSDLNVILNTSKHAHFLVYDGDWTVSAGKEFFPYQYLCCSVLYPEMNFYRVPRDATDVVAALLGKFNFDVEPPKKRHVAFRSSKSSSDDEFDGSEVVFFSFYDRKPAEYLKADNLNIFQHFLHRKSIQLGNAGETGLPGGENASTSESGTSQQEPLPLQDLPLNANAMAINPVGNMLRARRTEDFKAIPCPYLKNKGFCRFNGDRCRYNHTLFHYGQVDENAKQGSSLNQIPTVSVEELSTAQNTTPSHTKGGTITEPKGAHGHGTKNPSMIQKFGTPQVNRGQTDRTPTKNVGLNPPPKLYAAYDPEKMSADQVYHVVDRKNPIDEARLSSFDQKTGQRALIATEIRELRFEKGFGKVFDSQLQNISSHDSLARSLSFLSVTDASGLTDEAIIDFSIKCNPKVIILGGAIQITDAGFLSLALNCKNLEYLEVTGYGNKTGRLTGSCLRMLTESPTVGKALKEIVVKHHSISSQVALELSLSRRSLAITIGNKELEVEGINTNLWYAGRLAFANNSVVA
ncbi:hypothetical protein Dda_7243 [Drechslerella dactyloides]|uniref:C3H1-type domain-containing protein n=1 Tax=Drechslerella dactyloides TaxID=74499 RepID=A0AAD6IS17_DREDA|nr:hypothetical protein Dda_7243 [Drechslerella dactyloides]